MVLMTGEFLHICADCENAKRHRLDEKEGVRWAKSGSGRFLVVLKRHLAKNRSHSAAIKASLERSDVVARGDFVLPAAHQPFV
jgi:hypothetical protein